MGGFSSRASFEDYGKSRTGFKEEEKAVDLACGGRQCAWWIGQEWEPEEVRVVVVVRVSNPLNHRSPSDPNANANASVTPPDEVCDLQARVVGTS